MTKQFSIRIAGSEAGTFTCNDDDTLVSGALRNGSGFPYECNSGGCGTCQIEVLEGEVTELWPEAPGLSPRARERGRRLACQCVPESDCTIKVLSGDYVVPQIPPVRQTMSFVESRSVSHDMSEFIFNAPHAAEFLPGQFAMLSLPGVGSPRAYSMGNLANNEGQWRFVIKRVPGGKGTGVLFDSLEPGDEVVVDGPYGNSYLRTDSQRDIVCVAGGSGLSPVLSILRGAVRAPELSGHRLLLFFGGRGPADICVEEILQADPLMKGRVEVFTAISDENAPGASEWTGERGFIHELVKKVLGEKIPDFDYYFCGPPPMTDAIHRMMLMEYKVPAVQLHFDRFF